MTPHWVSTGSSISGIGYGATIVTNIAAGLTTPEFGVSLSIRGERRIQPCASWAEASEFMQYFCRVCSTWNAVQNRERALAQGFAVIG